MVRSEVAKRCVLSLKGVSAILRKSYSGLKMYLLWAVRSMEREGFLLGRWERQCSSSFESLIFLLLSSIELRVLLNLLVRLESPSESLVLVYSIWV